MATSKKAQTGVKVTKKTTVTPVKKTKKVDITLPKEKKGNMFDRNYPTTDRLLPAQNGKKMNPAKKTTTGGNRINTLLPGFVPPTDTRKGGMMPGLSKNGRSIKKSQNGTKTKDSTAYFSNQEKSFKEKIKGEKKLLPNGKWSKGTQEDLKNYQSMVTAKGNKERQSLKGKPGYDANGIQNTDPRSANYAGKKKMKNGGSLSGLKASTKRVGPSDAKGAWTKVQEKTLAGAKGKAKLTADKQLGATKMAKRGMRISKKK